MRKGQFSTDWLIVFTEFATIFVDTDLYLKKVDEAFTRWSMHNEDEVLCFTTLAGDEFTIRASSIDGYVRQNEQMRRQSWEWETWRQANIKAHKDAVGYEEDKENPYE